MFCPACQVDNLPGADSCESCGTPLYQEDIPLAHARSVLEKRLHKDSVETLRPREPVSIAADATVREAVALMKENCIGCLVVATESGRLLGILSEADLIQRIGGDTNLDDVTVSDIMTPNPESLRCDHPLGYVLQRMRVSDCRHLPVVDTDGRAIGVVSSRDVLNFLDDSLKSG